MNQDFLRTGLLYLLMALSLPTLVNAADIPALTDKATDQQIAEFYKYPDARHNIRFIYYFAIQNPEVLADEHANNIRASAHDIAVVVYDMLDSKQVDDEVRDLNRAIRIKTLAL